MTKKELNRRLREIRDIISWMQQEINNLKIDELGRSTFEDLMCLSSELYYDYANEYDPE